MHFDHFDPVHAASWHTRSAIERLRAREASEAQRVRRNRGVALLVACFALGALAALAALSGCACVPENVAHDLDRFVANDVAIVTSRRITVLTLGPRSTENDHERALLAAQLKLAEQVRRWVANNREGE